jgi:hypothetical protein
MLERGLPDDDVSTVKDLIGALDIFLDDAEKHDEWRRTKTMPARYIKSFLLVAEEEGLGPTDYAKRANVAVSVMSRHLLDIGERDRYMKPGLGWVTCRLNPMELRKKQYWLTDKGRALVHKFKRQLRNGA